MNSFHFKEIILKLAKKHVPSKRIVLSGGPSSGKTTLINELKNQGYYCLHEVSRELIREAQKKGIEQPFLTHPEAFNEEILKSRLLQFNAANNTEQSLSFYDRGLHDVVAYMNYANQSVPTNFSSICMKNKYDLVFLLPPWNEIYTQDQERYETYEQAKSVYQFLKNTYSNYGHYIIEVPFGTVADRISFILAHCK
ncbi:AAA family ATPase [Aquimarina agarivorans]|uniref:AAA family ATPase n=1 Tax=Aquimarina agarivorans TaxID=980584 RepID=UPI000248EC63|nr:ATP-binding protein [Aquimarina agarivorans]